MHRKYLHIIVYNLLANDGDPFRWGGQARCSVYADENKILIITI